MLIALLIRRKVQALTLHIKLMPRLTMARPSTPPQAKVTAFPISLTPYRIAKVTQPQSKTYSSKIRGPKVSSKVLLSKAGHSRGQRSKAGLSQGQPSKLRSNGAISKVGVKQVGPHPVGLRATRR